MMNISLMRFEQRPNNSNTWDVRYGPSGQVLATITETVQSGVRPSCVVQFYRHMGGFNSTPVVVPTREDAVRHIQKYFSGELERFVDDEP
jgi:hypothetical protein